jgi:hypothetical protein
MPVASRKRAAVWTAGRLVKRLPSDPWSVTMIGGLITAVIGGVIVALVLGGGSSGGPTSSPSRSRTSTSAPSPSESLPQPSASVTGFSSLPEQYMPVSLAQLCGAPGASSQFDSCGPSDGITQIGSQVFPYMAISPVYNDTPEVMTFPKTTCRSLTLKFAFSASEDNTVRALTNTVSVAQTAVGPKQATVSSNQVGTLTVKLDGGPWAIDAAANAPAPGGNWAIFLSGSAMCLTSNGE